MEDKYLQLFLDETSLYNDIVLGHLLPSSWWVSLPRFIQTWLRNYIAGTLLYFISGFLWCFYIYYLKRNVYLPKGMRYFIQIDCLLVHLLKFESWVSFDLLSVYDWSWPCYEYEFFSWVLFFLILFLV